MATSQAAANKTPPAAAATSEVAARASAREERAAKRAKADSRLRTAAEGWQGAHAHRVRNHLCLAEDIRLEAARTIVKNIPDEGHFNILVKYYNSRHGNHRYNEIDYCSAERRVNAVTALLEREGIARSER